MGNIRAYIRKEVLTPAVTLVFLTVYVVSALRMSPPVLDGLMQESAFPLMIFIVGAPTAAALLFEAVSKIRKELAAGKYVNEKKIGIKPLLIAVLCLMLGLGLETVGYLIVGPAFIFFFMLIYDDKPQEIRKKILLTLLICAFVYVLYTVIFDVRFPLLWSIL